MRKTLLISLLPLLLQTAAVAAPDAESVTFAHAGPVEITNAEYYAADQLGYFAQEGLTVEFRNIVGGSNAVAQTVTGRVDISSPGPEPVIIGSAKEKLPVRYFYNATPTVMWELVVPADSPIQTLQDLRGRRIGIFAPSASNFPQVKAILRRENIDPDKDVTIRSIGLGANALNAIKTGVVDVVALYSTQHATFETQGFAIRRLPSSPVVEYLFSNTLLAPEASFQDPAKRARLVKFARALAKGTLFCENNREACIKLLWKKYPEQKPTGVSTEVALKNATFILAAHQSKTALRDYQNGQYGLFTERSWKDYVDFLYAEKEIEKPVDIATLYTNDLIAEINDFDRQAVIKQALSYHE